MSDPSSRLGEIRPRSGDEFDIIQIAKMDARWLREQLGCAWAATTIEGLLEHVEQLQRDLDDANEAFNRAAAKAEVLAAQRQAVLDLCDEADRNALPMPSDARDMPAVTTSSLRAALGASS